MLPSSISPISPFFRLSGLTSTRSPTFQPATPCPTSAISPAMSSPITTGSGTLMPGMPRTVNTSWYLKNDAPARETVGVVENRRPHPDHHVPPDRRGHGIVAHDLELLEAAVLAQQQRLH